MNKGTAVEWPRVITALPGNGVQGGRWVPGTPPQEGPQRMYMRADLVVLGEDVSKQKREQALVTQRMTEKAVVRYLDTILAKLESQTFMSRWTSGVRLLRIVMEDISSGRYKQ